MAKICIKRMGEPGTCGTVDQTGDLPALGNCMVVLLLIIGKKKKKKASKFRRYIFRDVHQWKENITPLSSCSFCMFYPLRGYTLVNNGHVLIHTEKQYVILQWHVFQCCTTEVLSKNFA